MASTKSLIFANEKAPSECSKIFCMFWELATTSCTLSELMNDKVKGIMCQMAAT